MKITETVIDGKPGFLSEFALDVSKTENQSYRAVVLHVVTNERPENFFINRDYDIPLDIIPRKRMK